MDNSTSAQKLKRKIKITHFREKCIGCGACMMSDPDNWIIDEDGKATLKTGVEKIKGVYVGEIEQQDYEKNLKASDDCPVDIIKIE